MEDSRKRMKLTRSSTKRRHVDLMECYSRLTLDILSSPEHATWIPRMDGKGKFVHMGRGLTRRLIDFISKERGIGSSGGPRDWVLAADAVAPLPFFQSDDDYGFSFITGTPGAGKTCSLGASVLYLYGKFADQRSKGGIDHILFLEGRDFEKQPEKVFWRALLQAYADDDAALDELELMQAVTRDVIEGFILASEQRLIVVVDDGNKVKRGGDAHILLSVVRQYSPIIFCASVSSEWIDVMRHPKACDYEVVVGGLDVSFFPESLSFICWLQDKELACFLKRFDITGTNFPETGTIPRLMIQYATDTDLFEGTMEELEDGINQFLVKALQHPRAESLRGQLAGSLQVVTTLTPFLESRCFYRGRDGWLECLTARLLQYTKVRMAQILELQDLDSKLKELALWIEPILRHELRSRIGLNAEMAAVLAMKFFTGQVYYAENECVQLDVRRVQLFKGQMSKSVLEAESDAAEGGTLFVPSSGRHAGLDVYYRDRNVLIAVQISVQRNAEDHHDKTVEKAEEVFVGEKRRKILLWIIDTDGWCSYNTTTDGYYYVTMPFSFLSSQLAKIDDRLKALRTSSTQDVCWESDKNAGDSDWIQCDFCDLWYHQRCAVSGMKPRANLRRTTAKTGQLEYILSSAQPFECRACRDYMSRPRKENIMN